MQVEPGSPNKATWYVDGVLSSSSSTLGNNIGVAGGVEIASQWELWPSTYQLQVFGDTQTSQRPWNGNLYSLAMYDFSLTAAEVLQNYNARLPDSPPVSVDFTGTVNEDGMPAAYRKDPALYWGPDAVPALELGWVSLAAVDQDEDTGFPNYNASDRVRRPMKVFVGSLPPRAKLYHFASGAEITAAPAEVPPTFEDGSGNLYDAAGALALGSGVHLTKSYRVRVRPERDQFSVPDGLGGRVTFANFSYYAVDGLTGARSSRPDAACNLVVLPMNDPPRPRSFSQVMPAGVKTLVSLNSSDVDNAAPFANAYITRYPAHGVLYGVDLAGNISSCVVADPSDAASGGHSWLFHCVAPASCAAGSPSTCTSVLGAAYLFTNWTALNLASAGADGVVGFDSFEYVVQDALGSNSTAATVHITLTTPLVVEAAVDVVRHSRLHVAPVRLGLLHVSRAVNHRLTAITALALRTRILHCVRACVCDRPWFTRPFPRP